MKKSQLALSNYPYYKHSWKYTLESLHKLGAEAIELYCCDPHFHIDDVGLPEVSAMKKDLGSYGMHPVCLTPEQVMYPINIAAANPFARKRSIETYVKVLQYASELESPLVQFHAGFALLDEDRDIVWQRSVEALSYLAHIAEGYGVTIAMESAHKLFTVLNSSADIARMLHDVGSPSLRGMVDTLCLEFCNEDIDTLISNLGKENIVHLHISDCIVGEPHDHLIPGEGTMDLEGVMNALDAIGYDQYVTLEMISPHEYHPEEATRKGADWLRARMTD